MSKKTLLRPAWAPTSEITQHSGKPLHPKMTFFVPPPPDIGSVVTAYSSVRGHKPSRRIQWQFVGEAVLMIVLSFPFLGVFLSVGFYVALEQLFGYADNDLLRALAFLLAFLVLAILFKAIISPCFDRDAVCSYVGEQGIAEYCSTKGQLNEQVLLFADVRFLRKQIMPVYVKQYRNTPWIYSGTRYCLTWRSAQTESVHFYFPADNKTWFNLVKQKSSGHLIGNKSIVGLFFSNSGRLRQDDPYHFAVSAERIWTSLRFQKAQAELEQFGAAEFLVEGGGLLEVKPGGLKVVDATGIHQYSGDQVRLSHEDGKVVIERIGPDFPKYRSDVCVINHASIDNLTTFLTLFHSLVVRTVGERTPM